MQLGDIPECVSVLLKHAVVAQRYGPAIGHLAEAWRRLLPTGPSLATVFHAGDNERAPVCFFGFSVIVHDDFVREIKTPPQFWVGPELTRRVIQGQSPVLTDKQIRESNSGGGMNLLFWEACAMPEYEAHSELPRYMMAAMIEVHQGYLWKEIIGTQPESVERLNHTLNTGGFLWDPIAGCYTNSTGKDPHEVVRSPHILGLTRELERSRRSNWSGSWVGALFDYQAPRLGFSRSEQRLLSCALSGATDQQLAETLETAHATVKKSWVSIYNRVEDRLPALLRDPLRTETPAATRGKEKRRWLLAYLREHPEELRPVSRKLLRNTSSKMVRSHSVEKGR